MWLPTMDSYTIARENMIKSQVMTNRLTDKNIITLLSDFPRHIFVPEHLKTIAYCDDFIPLNDTHSLMPLMTFARAVQAADISLDDNILDIGCSSGFSAAILAKLGNKVVAIESDSDMASDAHQALSRLHIDNVIIITGKLKNGQAESGPYDVIFMNGAVDHVPDTLFDQLSDKGRLITFINDSPYTGKALLYKKFGDNIQSHTLFEVKMPKLHDFIDETLTKLQ